MSTKGQKLVVIDDQTIIDPLSHPTLSEIADLSVEAAKLIEQSDDAAPTEEIQSDKTVIEDMIAEIIVQKPPPPHHFEDGQYMFSLQSDECEVLMKILEKFVGETKCDAQPGMNRDQGEIFAEKFEEYVVAKYPALAKWLEIDGGVYEAVLMEWSGN